MSDNEGSFSDADESIEESVIDDIDDDIVSEVFDTDTPFEDIGTMRRVKSERSTINVLNKYEMANVIGSRARDFDRGVVPNVTVPKGMTKTLDIAEYEFKMGKSPYTIRRNHNDDTYEDWSLKELIVPRM